MEEKVGGKWEGLVSVSVVTSIVAETSPLLPLGTLNDDAAPVPSTSPNPDKSHNSGSGRSHFSADPPPVHRGHTCEPLRIRWVVSGTCVKSAVSSAEPRM